MKHRQKLLALAALLAAALTTHAQTWQVLAPTSTFTPAGTGVSVLIDPFSEPANSGVFLATTAHLAAPATIYRLTPDAGFNSFVYEAVDVGGFNNLNHLGYNALDGTPNGTLYAVGQVRVVVRNQNYGVWKVRKSLAGGEPGTWGDDDTFALSSKADAHARGFTSDAKGNAFVCGSAGANTKGDTNPHWIVRRKTPTGAFATVSDIKTTVAVGASAEAMCALPGDGISPTVVFAVGHVGYKWNVMRSQQSGAAGTWFPAGASTWPAARSLAVATDAAYRNGIVYVVGYYDGGYALGCIVQTSNDGGNTWQTLLDENSDLPTEKWRIAIDSVGRATLAGVIRNRDGTNPRWIVVRPGDPQNTTSWQTGYANPLVHPFSGSHGDRARGIAADPSGNVFIGGYVNWNGFSGAGLLRLVP